jgi:hypothetical protein
MESRPLPAVRDRGHNGWLCTFTTYVYRTSGVIFFHRLLHSYTRHIERGSRGERDIVPSTQDLRPRICSLRKMRVSG